MRTYLSSTTAASFSFPPKSPPPLEIPKTEDPATTETPNADCSAVAVNAERSKIAKLKTVFMVDYQRIMGSAGKG